MRWPALLCVFGGGVAVGLMAGGTWLWGLLGIALVAAAAGLARAPAVPPTPTRPILTIGGKPDKDRFVAAVAHDLRTPVTAIQGHAELLLASKGGTLTDQQREYVHAIQSGCQAMSHLANQLLELSRIDSGPIDMTLASLNLKDCLEAACTLVAPTCEKQGLKLVRELPQHTMIVAGSPNRLRQAFANLLSNAVKFTPQGAVGVSLDEFEGDARVQVWDTGPGIDAAILPHIFEEFFQGSREVRQRHGGAGLGLAIAYRIVSMHGGTIEAANRPEGGAVFTVRLPLIVARRRGEGHT